jgi:hypothetical protein
MTRSLTFTAAALAAVLLAALAVEAQDATPDSSPFADPTAAADRIAAQADAAAAQAEAAAERVAAQAEVIAERAAEAAHRAAEDAELRIQHSADVAIDAAVGGPIPVDDPFAAPARVGVFMRGPKFERRAADPETIKMMDLDRKLSKQISELVAKYKSLTDEDERKRFYVDMKLRVEDQFTVRQGLREKELVELEEQVKRLRDLHEKRNAQKDQIIGDRVQQLLREADGLGWGDAANDFSDLGGAAGGGGGVSWGGDRKFELKFDAAEPVKIKAPIEGAIEKARRLIISSGGDVLEVPPLPAKEPKAPTPKKASEVR